MRIRHLAAIFVIFAISSVARAGTITSFDADWRFMLGDPADAQQPQFDDSSWTAVELPHDWSIAGPIARNNPTGNGGGYFPAGVGWYRKAFTLPEGSAGKLVMLRFDGVYMLSEVRVNGKSMGTHPYGYTPFSYDITSELKAGQPNTIAVRVDNSKQVNSRWYSGSGIYRHVVLEMCNPGHLVRESVQIKTVSADKSQAKLKIAMSAEYPGVAPEIDRSAVTTEIFELDEKGNRAKTPVARTGPVPASFGVKDGKLIDAIEMDASVDRPHLWSPEHPSRYMAVTTLTVSGSVDTLETPFGIRTIEVSPSKGFLINGERVLLAGGCVHHDNGPLGAAAFDRAEERRVEILKAAGFNAIRTSHNPPSTAFLDACDRLGMLVLDEAFDTWEHPKNPQDYNRYFNDWWQRDIDAMVQRDRNHPSVVMWSIGNEINDLGNARGIADGTKLAARVKELDPTRPVTDAVQLYGGMVPREFPWTWNDADPLLAKLDVVGYNYQMGHYNQDHRRVPDRVIVATESYPRDMYPSWQWAADHTWVVGDFIWTAWDYLGESGVGKVATPGQRGPGFPYHGAYCGDIDLTGFRKPQSHARNITWDRGEKMYASVIELGPDGKPLQAPGWGINTQPRKLDLARCEGQSLDVQVYSRCDTVRVSLNGTVIGEKPTGRGQQFKAVISVPYAAGTLKTEGLVGGQVVATSELKTTGPVVKLRLTPDRDTIHADGQDLSFITVESLDADGNFQPNGDQQVNFETTGAGSLAGVSSGDLNNTDSYQAKTRKLFQGRALVIVRASHQPGEIEVHATADGLTEARAEIKVR